MALKTHTSLSRTKPLLTMSLLFVAALLLRDLLTELAIFLCFIFFLQATENVLLALRRSLQLDGLRQPDLVQFLGVRHGAGQLVLAEHSMITAKLLRIER